MGIQHSIDKARATLDYKIPATPAVGLVLGSGLGGFVDHLRERVSVPYIDIDGMPLSNVAGHAGNLVFGNVADVPIVAMQGRVHLYEGHSAHQVVFGVRLMRSLGVEIIIVTNAAGGIADTLMPGDLMLLEDHLNLTGHTPLQGPHESSVGPRFVDMSGAYDRALREHAQRAAQAQDLKIKSGIYAGLLGPTYETPAEVRMLRTLGADAVGMSTVLEVIAARHMGARVLGMSCITNRAAGLKGATLDHNEVQQVAARSSEGFASLLRALIPRVVTA